MTELAMTANRSRVGAHPGRVGNFFFGGSAWLFALLVLILLAAVMFSLVNGAAPAFEKFGVSFIWTEVWNPNKDRYGALAPLYGTLITSLIAMVIGVPISIGIAIFLTELCRPISGGRSPRRSSCSRRSPASFTGCGDCSSWRR